MKNILSLFILVSSLVACSNHNPPEINPPLKFNSASINQNITESIPYLAWWKQFDDPKLNQLLESGLKNNNDVQIAYANLNQAQGQLRQVQLSWIPFVDILAGYTSNPAFGDIGTFYSIWPQYTINLMQLPFLQKQAEYNLALQQAKISAVRLTLIGQITSSYLTYLGEQRQLELLKKLQHDLQLMAKIKQQAFNGGLSSEQEVELLQAQEEKIVAQQKIVANNLVSSQNSLRYLLNQNPGTISTKNNFELINENMLQPGSLPASVLANRPDLLMAELQVRVAGEGINVSASNLFPSVQLDRFMAMQSGNGVLGTPNAPTTMNEAYLDWQISPSVFGQIEAQQGSYKAATYNYIKTARQILRDVDNDFAQTNYLAAHLQAETKAYTHTQRQFQLQNNLYNQGLIPYFEVINSQILLDNQALTINQSKLQYLMAQVKLYQDLAAGYKSQFAEESAPNQGVNK